jgi:hypothetical protein
MSRFENMDLSHQGATRTYFSLAQANRALVLVRRIVQDITEQYGRMIDLQESLEIAQGNGAYDNCDSLQQSLVDAAKRLQAYAAELDDLGVELKDWAAGVVDFPCLLDGREACLSWRHGESNVEYWHEMGQEPASRQAIGEMFVENAAALR